MSGDSKGLRRHFTAQTGEYFVLFRLSCERLLASLAPPGSPNIDILVSDPSTHLLATIQVKSRAKGRDGGWSINPQRLTYTSDYHFYVFVDLEDRSTGMPASYVVPSAVVRKLVKDELSKHAKGDDAADARLFEDTKTSKRSINFYRLLPVLRKPPPKFTANWMAETFQESYWLISKPLFSKSSSVWLKTIGGRSYLNQGATWAASSEDRHSTATPWGRDHRPQGGAACSMAGRQGQGPDGTRDDRQERDRPHPGRVEHVLRSPPGRQRHGRRDLDRVPG